MNAFLYIEGVTGETKDANHKGWIDIDSWSWDVHRNITSNTSTRGDRESSNAEVSDLFITKKMDVATNSLFIEACCGRGKTVHLHLAKTGSGDGADVFMEYTFKNCKISHYGVNGDSDGLERPTEELKISFTELSARYIQYDEDNKACAPNAICFDTATNTKK